MSFIIGNIILPLLTGTTILYAPPGIVPSACTAAEAAESTRVSLLGLTPQTTIQIAQDSDLLARIVAAGPRVLYAGGDMPTSVGAALSQRLRLSSAMASTEFGLYHGFVRTSLADHSSTWHAQTFHPSCGVDFVPVPDQNPDIFQAVVRRTPDAPVQPVFRIFPDTQEYATGDLYQKSAVGQEMWEYLGRADDMIIFSSGEKFWPGDVERDIAAHADVACALVVGTGRARSALLLEPTPRVGCLGGEALLGRVWPAIRATHAVCSPAARIRRALVVVADAGRPFVRTPKGSVARGPTARLYARDLDARYEAAAAEGVEAPESAGEILVRGAQV